MQSLLIENRDLRNKERKVLVFMLRFMLGIISPNALNAKLRNASPAKDLQILRSNAYNSSRRNRVHSLIAIFHLCGVSRNLVADILHVRRETITKYLRLYGRSGVDALFAPRKEIKKFEDPQYKNTLFAVLHSPPRDYGFNRTTWRRKDLHTAMARLGMPIGKNYIDRIIKNAGYRFLKAKKVLTSNDPHYREKVDRIHQILARLGRSERFFSIDEFGPVAVKRHGGRRLVGPSEHPTVPQIQKSKGCLIITAALELSRNQVTHFYSDSKNSGEMIKLLEVLLHQYRKCTKLYLSWDMAGWHASKAFEKKIREINTRKYRRTQRTPIVKLAPLPAGAQFLNVIESVFNGLAVSVIHNSDYESVDAAKAAINRHFMERNLHFRENPKRAGNKIWGKERVPCVFEEGHNCKDPRFR